MSITPFNSNKYLIFIVGPTGVGKTAIALLMAKVFGASIFSADSRQIYKELTIGTAKPSKDELEMINHYFIDHISIADSYSVGQYVNDFDKVINAYFENNNVAIVCGGTGLYIRSIMDGIDDFPDVDDSIVQYYNELLEKEGITHIQKELALLDPTYYNIVDKNNPRRIIRALSIIKTTGQTFSSYLNKEITPTNPLYTPIRILLDRPRQELYDRINQRVELMLENGLLEEVGSLINYKHLQALQTVGYSELFDYFEGKSDVDMAVNLIKQNSRRYAKRQITWFKKYGDWTSFHPDEVDHIFKFIQSSMVD